MAPKKKEDIKKTDKVEHERQVYDENELKMLPEWVQFTVSLNSNNKSISNHFNAISDLIKDRLNYKNKIDMFTREYI